MNDETAKALRAPFKAAQIGHLPKVVCKACSERSCSDHKPSVCKTCKAFLGKHIHISYVGHAHVRERLLDVDPEWQWEPLSLDGQGLPALDQNGGMWIRLTIGGTHRLGYGHAGAKRGGDAIKEIIGDALRNAAMSFGVALDLWKKEPPVPVADADEPVLTPDEQAAELRTLIAAVGSKMRPRMPVAAIDADVHEWSRGEHAFRTAPPEVLQEYLKYLEAKK